jgi:hypothetical protein
MPLELTIALIGALAGLLPAGLSGFFSWRAQRSRDARHDRLVRLAQARVAFLQAWLAVQKDVSSAEQLEAVKLSVAGELERIRQALPADLATAPAAAAEGQRERNALQRALLIYTPLSVTASVLHTLFYMLLSITLLLYALALYNGISGAYALGNLLLGTTVFALPIGIVLLIIRRAARQLDRRSLQRQLAQEAGGEPAPAAAVAACEQCGAELRGGAKYCAQCGAVSG